MASYASSSRRKGNFSVMEVPSRYHSSGTGHDRKFFGLLVVVVVVVVSLSRRVVVDGASFTVAFDLFFGHQRRKAVGLMVIVQICWRHF